MKKTGSFIFSLILLFLAGCGGDYTAEKAYWHFARSCGQFMQDPARANDADFQRTADGLRAIIQHYPSWKRAAELQFNLGKLYASRRDFTAAENEFRKVLTDFPDKQELCVHAQFAIG